MRYTNQLILCFTLLYFTFTDTMFWYWCQDSSASSLKSLAVDAERMRPVGNFYFASGKDAKYCNQFVCLSVSVCLFI